jgi:cobalt-zinc-cadmium efflux system outer membrane protein
MRRLLIALPLIAAGCRNHAEYVPDLIESQLAAVAPEHVESGIVPCEFNAKVADGPVDLPALWNLALAHNPALREASAMVEEARGRVIQAHKYPNPRVAYNSDEVFSSVDRRGNQTVQLSQEIVTAGKRQLDIAVTSQDFDAARVALLGRKFEVLTRIRRAYYDYLALAYTLQVSREAVASLEKSLELTRQLVEKAKTRPRSDLLRIQALLDEALINQRRILTNLEAAWRELAAEVGVPSLPRPADTEALPPTVPGWELERINQRVQSSNTLLRQAALEAESARLVFERARAEAIPNVNVGAGYIRSFIDQDAGAVFSVETHLPIWDRRQGHIHEARANWARAQAALRTLSTRLSRDTAEAFARYEGARQQVERLTVRVLPQLVESLQQVREGYQAGTAGITFADVQLAIEALNDVRLRLAQAKRELWQAVADLQGLMQLDLGEEALPLLPAPEGCPAPK